MSVDAAEIRPAMLSSDKIDLVTVVDTTVPAGGIPAAARRQTLPDDTLKDLLPITNRANSSHAQ